MLMTTFSVGQKVKILRTGDKDIDNYVGQIGIILSFNALGAMTVRMPDEAELCLNYFEVEAV